MIPQSSFHETKDGNVHLSSMHLIKTTIASSINFIFFKQLAKLNLGVPTTCQSGLLLGFKINLFNILGFNKAHFHECPLTHYLYFPNPNSWGFHAKSFKTHSLFKKVPIVMGSFNPLDLETSTRFTNANDLTSKTNCKPLGCHLHRRWFVMDGPDSNVENWSITFTQLHFSYVSCPSSFVLC